MGSNEEDGRKKEATDFCWEWKKLFTESNQATSNESIIKWNCLPNESNPEFTVARGGDGPVGHSVLGGPPLTPSLSQQ